MNQPVSIIIPNYNGQHLLMRNLPSVLEAARQYGGQTEIIVVDDGSRDDSTRILRQEFPEVVLVIHEENRGFAEAIHTGVRTAKSELLFLLNSDVQPESGCLQPLTEYFGETETFSVCPLILDDDGKINRHSWNIRELRCSGLKPVAWDMDSALLARRKAKLPTLYASGGSMMVRKSMFLDLQGFCPMYKPFYGEDYDLGLRAWRRGWRSYFEPNASVLHQKQGSIKDNVRRSFVKQVRRRNKYILEWTHIPALKLWSCVVPLTVWQLLGEMVLLDKVNLKGFSSALIRIPEILAVRRELVKTDKISLGQVLEIVKFNLNLS